MFQAINQFNPPFFRFFFIIILTQIPLWAAPSLPVKSCSLLPSGAPGDYFLSRGFQEQRDGFHKTDQRKPEEAKQHHLNSVGFFEKFHLCQKENNLGPTYLSSLSSAVSYLELGDLESAYRFSDMAYNMFTEPNVPPRESILLKARIMLRKAELPEAALVLEKHLRDFPNDNDFLFYLGNINYDLKKWNHSLLYFGALLDIIQKRDTNSKFRHLVLKFLGDLNFRLDYPRKSISYYTEYLSYIPNDTEVLQRIGGIYYTLGEFANAKVYLSLVRQTNPRETDASNMLGEMYFVDSRSHAMPFFEILNKERKIGKDGNLRNLYKFLTGDRSMLIGSLNLFIEKNPNHLPSRIAMAELISQSEPLKQYIAYFEIGELAFQLRNYKTAENYYTKAIDISKSLPELSKNTGILYEKLSQCQEALGQLHHAILAMRKGIKATDDPIAQNAYSFRLTYLLMSPYVGKSSEAMEISNMLIARDPNQANYNYLNGLLHLQKEDFLSALTSFNRAVELDPKNSNYNFYVALSYDKLKDFPNTEKYLLLAIETNPEGPNAYNYLGYLYAEKGIKKIESESFLLKATNIEPDNAAYQDSLGWIYFKEDKLAESSLHLHFAELISRERNQEDAVIYDHLGDVHRKESDLVKADFYWEKALALYKDADEIKKLKIKMTNNKKDLLK